MNDDAKNSVTLDYLIDLISSIKAALHNIDNVGNQNNEILSEVSENLSILTELYKKQGQDQRITQNKLGDMSRLISDLSNRLELHKQQIKSSNDSLENTLAVVNEMKNGSIENANEILNKLRDTIIIMQNDVSYLKVRENQKEIAKDLEYNEKIEKSARIKVLSENKKDNNWFSKSVFFLKTFISGISSLYKVLIVIAILFLFTLLLINIITWNDVIQLISKII